MMFSKTAIISTTAAALVIAALSSAGAAQAESAVGNNAGDVVGALIGEGYNVQINGTPSAPLSGCTVANLYGLSNPANALSQPADPHVITNVYVDVTCASDS